MEPIQDCNYLLINIQTVDFSPRYDIDLSKIVPISPVRLINFNQHYSLRNRETGQKGPSCFFVVIGLFVSDLLPLPRDSARAIKDVLCPNTYPILHADEDKVIILWINASCAGCRIPENSFSEIYAIFFVKLKYKRVFSLSQNFTLAASTIGAVFAEHWLDNESNLGGKILRFAFSSTVKGKIAFKKSTTATGSHIWVDQDGQCLYHLHYLVQKMNFTYEPVPSSGGIGTLLPSGSFTGNLGQIQKGIADFSMPISFSQSRLLHFGLTASLKDEPGKIISRIPRKLSKSTKAVWLSDWIMLVLLSLSTVIFASFIGFSGATVFKKNVLGLGQSISFVMAALLAQGVPQSGKSVKFLLSQRMLMSLWLFCTLCLGQTYLSGILGFLSMHSYEIVPSTMEDLAEMDVPIGLTVIGFTYEIFKNSPDPLFQKVAAKMELFDQPFDCISRLLTPDKLYVCITYESSAHLYLLKIGYRLEHAPLTASTTNIFYGRVCIATLPRSPLLSNFHVATQQAVSSGLALHWDQMDLRNKRNAIRVAEMKSELGITSGVAIAEEVDNGETLAHLQGVFIILAVGMGMATGICIIEMLKGNMLSCTSFDLAVIFSDKFCCWRRHIVNLNIHSKRSRERTNWNSPGIHFVVSPSSMTGSGE